MFNFVELVFKYGFCRFKTYNIFQSDTSVLRGCVGYVFVKKWERIVELLTVELCSQRPYLKYSIYLFYLNRKGFF